MNFSDLGLDVSRETIERIAIYETLVKKWNPKINLIARSTLPDLFDRHIRDSAQLMTHIPLGAKRLGDFGSGGGFPGMVLAIFSAELRPDLDIKLVESDQRKAAFLRSVARETGISVDVTVDRIENLDPLNLDVVTARALASLKDLCSFTARHLGPKGDAFFLKGKSWGKEVEEAEVEWKFELAKFKSETNPEAVILHLREIKHV